ncbi:uncharacterized protein LOC129012317 [Pongo pygmaeus]|uniref:uncharacterized protein LOC129012317 n=1 Tax=Pongo pygmaeus TaxID=9600 RepID=UPI0023E24DDD|nr:uncharacterized protein LOC129012317 [Pongo pygmaeus]
MMPSSPGAWSSSFTLQQLLGPTSHAEDQQGKPPGSICRLCFFPAAGWLSLVASFLTHPALRLLCLLRWASPTCPSLPQSLGSRAQLHSPLPSRLVLPAKPIPVVTWPSCGLSTTLLPQEPLPLQLPVSSRFPVPPTSPCWCLHLLPSILQCRLLWAWPQGYGQTPVPSQRPLVIVPWHVGRGPAGSAEELRMEAVEEALMGPTIPDPSLLPGGPLVSFLFWAEAITWIPTWEGTSNVRPQPLSSSKSLHSHGDALHLFPRDRLDPETLDPGPPLE